MANIENKLFLDFEGLSQYDELIKKYVQNEAVTSTNQALEQLTLLGQAVAANTEALAILNGEAEGSVSKAVKDAVAALVNGAPEALDTLKELADWIEGDETASAALVKRVADNEAAIEALQDADEIMKEYVDTQDVAYYDAIQSIANLKIMSLFPVKQTEDVSAAAAITSLNEGEAVELLPNQNIADDIVIDKSCYINANGATFTGVVTVPAGADVVIENATFSKPVVVQ